MLAFGKMEILDNIFGAVETIDAADVRELNVGGVFGPVFAAGDKQLGTGSRQGSDISAICLVGLAFVDRHSTFAIAAAKEMCRDHNDRN